MMQSEHNHASVVLQLEWIGSLHATQVETLSAILTTVRLILLTEGLSFNEMGNQPFKRRVTASTCINIAITWSVNYTINAQSNHHQIGKRKQNKPQRDSD